MPPLKQCTQASLNEEREKGEQMGKEYIQLCISEKSSGFSLPSMSSALMLRLAAWGLEFAGWVMLPGAEGEVGPYSMAWIGMGEGGSPK